MQRIIKKILLEEYNKKPKNKNEIAIALSSKALQHIINGLRYIESALQFVEDEEIRKTLDEVRRSLLSDGGRQKGFKVRNDNRFDNTINILGNMIDKNTDDITNFNINGKGSKAPKGDF